MAKATSHWCRCQTRHSVPISRGPFNSLRIPQELSRTLSHILQRSPGVSTGDDERGHHTEGPDGLAESVPSLPGRTVRPSHSPKHSRFGSHHGLMLSPAGTRRERDMAQESGEDLDWVGAQAKCSAATMFD